MTFNIPYSFVPGTKAKAEEVNSNFIAIANELNEQTTTLHLTKLNTDFSNLTSEGEENLKNLVGGDKNIGEIVTSVVPLTDSGLHLLDGSLLQSGGIYSDFVDYIADLYGDGTNIPEYFCSESDWQDSVTDYGVCGKFVYDSANNTVRLPKITGLVEGTTDVTALGDLIEQYVKLPNITGKFTGSYATLMAGSGAFYDVNSSYHVTGADSGGKGIGFDASRSSSVYSGNGSDTEIQPQAIKILYYIVLATTSRTDVQIDIDEIATDLNGKADVNLNNINPSRSVKNEIVGWGMPDYTAGITVAYNAFQGSGWQAPNSGIIIGSANWGSANGYVYVNNSPTVCGNTETGEFFLTVSKSDIVTQSSNSVIENSYTHLTFYPLKGAN